MSDEIKEIIEWDWPDIRRVPDGYDTKTMPDLTWDNFCFLVEQHNRLVRAFNELKTKTEAKA